MGQNFKNMVFIEDLFIWGQVPKSWDCPPKIRTLGRLNVGTFGSESHQLFLYTCTKCQARRLEQGLIYDWALTAHARVHGSASPIKPPGVY